MIVDAIEIGDDLLPLLHPGLHPGIAGMGGAHPKEVAAHMAPAEGEDHIGQALVGRIAVGDDDERLIGFARQPGGDPMAAGRIEAEENHFGGTLSPEPPPEALFLDHDPRCFITVTAFCRPDGLLEQFIERNKIREKALEPP